MADTAATTLLNKVRPVLKVCRRYAATVLFPTISGYLIYVDYSRTQRWKKSKAISQSAAVTIQDDAGGNVAA